MEVFITGGSGFVGCALCAALLSGGHQVTVLSRSAQASQRLPKGVGYCLGDPTEPGPWQTEAARHQGFVNLAGASIFQRWTPDYKKAILDSRVRSTRNLVQALASRQAPEPAVLVSASAVGFYGSAGDQELDESSPGGDDFLAQVCRQWENEALEALHSGARVVRARFGIVLGDHGGALDQMLPLFRKGLGGPLGGGRQWFSWIHQRDLVGALALALSDPRAQGAMNCTSPQPVTNRELAKALGKALDRPAWLPAPALAVRLALGELSSVVLGGQRVLPRLLLAMGFHFGFPSLEAALADLVGPR